MRFHILIGAATIGLLGSGPAEPDPIKAELAKMQGTWQLVSAESGGKKTPDEQVKKIRVVIKGDMHSVYFGEKTIAKKVRFKIDPTKSPKTVDDFLDDGKVIRSIYELKGDTLKSCVAPPGEDRPKEFAAPAGSRYTLRIFKLVQP
jgi:uncharacterized protein (TIGR03067 family)